MHGSEVETLAGNLINVLIKLAKMKSLIEERKNDESNRMGGFRILKVPALQPKSCGGELWALLQPQIVR